MLSRSKFCKRWSNCFNFFSGSKVGEKKTFPSLSKKARWPKNKFVLVEKSGRCPTCRAASEKGKENLEGPELRTHYWEDGEETKSQHLAGFEPTTSLIRGVCSTAVLQPPAWKRKNKTWLPQGLKPTTFQKAVKRLTSVTRFMLSSFNIHLMMGQCFFDRLMTLSMQNDKTTKWQKILRS